MKTPRFLSIGGVVLPFLIIVIFLWWQNGLAPVDPSTTEKVTVVIKKNEDISEIARQLKSQSIIKDTLHFKILAFVMGVARKIQAGTFYLSPSMSSREVGLALTKGSNDQWVTIIEGLRQEQIGKLLQEKGFPIDLLEWEKEIKKQNLEGKLFPDSYLFPQGASQGKILGIINKNFQKKVLVGLAEELKSSNLSLEEILILASIVEREAKTEVDRPLVAGILLKRWQSHWPLQADATVQYAIASSKFNPSTSLRTRVQNEKFDWWPKKITANDLKIKSSYNTYLYRGLPPTPICNPGLSSIEAILHPQNSLFWFYLSSSNGQMHYAKTASKHAENIRLYLRQN